MRVVDCYEVVFRWASSSAVMTAFLMTNSTLQSNVCFPCSAYFGAADKLFTHEHCRLGLSHTKRRAFGLFQGTFQLSVDEENPYTSSADCRGDTDLLHSNSPKMRLIKPFLIWLKRLSHQISASASVSLYNRSVGAPPLWQAISCREYYKWRHQRYIFIIALKIL